MYFKHIEAKYSTNFGGFKTPVFFEFLLEGSRSSIWPTCIFPGSVGFSAIFYKVGFRVSPLFGIIIIQKTVYHFENGDFHRLPGFFSDVFFCWNSLSSRMIVTIWCPWVSRLTRRMWGEGNGKAVGRRFFGRFVECAPYASR